MRKISIFSFIVAIFSLCFGAFPSVMANGWGFQNTQKSIETTPYFCQNKEDCTLEAGLKQAKNALWDVASEDSIVEYSQDVVKTLLTYISLIAVIYIIWTGFRILTSNGDDSSLKDAKKTILYVMIGIIVMWLAYPIVMWIIGVTTGNNVAKNSNTPNHSSIFPTAYAQAYTESENGTFAEYKYRLQVIAEKMEAELRVNKKVSSSIISEAKSLVQQAFDRLPDRNVDAARENESNKRLVDMYLDLAAKEPNSQQAVGQAISQLASFAQQAKIHTIKWSISATPTMGNSPLVVSFSAQNVIDPSGTNPPNHNYIWWIRENGGIRRELGRWPSLTHEFSQEGTFTVNLDVLSASRNSKGRTDVLPLSTSTNIQVQPRLGEITLLINGINVSNMNEIKITPAIASQGLIFDATASRAIGNGKILETKWDFGNGNNRTYKSAPGVERQVFATSGEYPVKLSFTTNDGKNFSKDITLRIVDPAATIKATKTTINAGETISFSAETFFGNIRNVEYIWKIQSNETGKQETQTGKNANFSYTFAKIGSYTVTLTTKNPNGDIDTDSKTITVESREPVATLDAPRQMNSEKPNTFIFDASRSFDPDTNTRQGLTYTWRINGELVTLDEVEGTSPDQKWSKGSLTFDSIGENTISVTVANAHGKIAVAEQKFSVTSTLSGNVIITPQVTQVGKTVTFIAQAKNAQFYTWNMGDGSPQKAGSDKNIQHTYKQTGVYNVTLTLQGADNTTTTINRKVYITDMDSPFAVINFANASNSVIQQSGVCDGKDAYVLKRGESTQIDGNKSINIDGISNNLDYTWKYMWKIFTLSTISENFKELGCFPISLTVKSKNNGASHTTTEYIKLENQLPTLTNITTTIDSNKQDSQKIIVKAHANGASDPDGVITSYVWYYKTASDEEPQGLQITQKPEMTFVLPNITEKYQFGVIIEDNDGARIDSKEILSNNAPLIVDNENSNIHLPLITLSSNKKVAKIGEAINFTADVKTILGTNVTTKSQYAWDFDGDGRFDDKSSAATISHTFDKAWEYKVRVRATNNGVSNTKTLNITVRNELKAAAQGYRLPNNQLYLLNTSSGVYDKAQWKIGENSFTTLDNIVIDAQSIPTADEKGSIGTLKIWSNDTENSTADIILNDIQTVEKSSGDTLSVQSFPKIENDTVIISDPAQSLKIAFFGNEATHYAIDTDLSVDSDMDGTTDNDVDNRNSASYTDGSLFVISDFGTTKTRERKIKLTTYNNSTPIASKIITAILDFIPENTAQQNTFTILDTQPLSDSEKERLETLANMIRKLGDGDRIILMQKYNILAENWMSPFEKAKNLVDLQTLIFETKGIDDATKQSFSDIIDQLLINDADATNAVTVAIKLIRDLIPTNSQNYSAMMEKVDAIASHPTDSVTNKALATELLVLIQQEPSSNLDDKYKLIIRKQIEDIVKNGNTQNTATESTTPTKTTETSSSGIFGMAKSIFVIIAWIFGIIALICLGLFIWYKWQSKDENLGFQDFLIDRLSGKEKTQETTIAVTPTPIKTESQEEKKPDIDPLKTYTPPVATVAEQDNIATETLANTADATMPDWLKTPENSSEKSENAVENSSEKTDILAENPLENIPEKISENTENVTEEKITSEQTGGLPDWLTPLPAENTQNSNELPDWLKVPENSSEKSENAVENSSEKTDILAENPLENISEKISENTENVTEEKIAPEQTGGLPDWLTPLPAENTSETENLTENTNSTSETTDNPLPDWIQSAHSENISLEENAQNTEETASLSINELNSDNFDENNFSYTRTKESENAGESLPDWLKESAEQMSEINALETENSENSEEIILEQTSHEEIVTEEEIVAENVKNTQNTDEIPDWIQNIQTLENTENAKNEENTKNTKTEKKAKNSEKNVNHKQLLREFFEEKIEAEEKKKSQKKPKKSDDDIPEWLK